MECRDFTVGESCIISFLLRAAKKDEDYISNFFAETQCSDMDDGGMGGLRFVPSGKTSSSCIRKFGSEISSCHFTDADGILVSVALYVDQFGCPVELDVWKVDFSPLVRIPNDDSEFVLDTGHQLGCVGRENEGSGLMINASNEGVSLKDIP